MAYRFGYFIKLKLFGNLADSLHEIKWHPTQKIEELSDGCIILSAEVPYLNDVARWVLADAPNVRIIEPEELKAKVREFAIPLIQE